MDHIFQYLHLRNQQIPISPEKFFNVSLSRARQSIERCFALLKGISLFIFHFKLKIYH